MKIVFFCQSCGSRFEVDPRVAGKQGRCNKCGQRMTVPHAEQIASMAAMPALAAAGVGAGVGAGPAAEGASVGSVLRAGISKLALAPISVDRMQAYPRRPSALDDAEDSKPYVLATPERRPSSRGGSGPANVVVRVWRRQLGGIQKIFRKINETAYLVSVPFLMILLLGAIVRNRPMALFGATVVVLLNIGRLVAGGANLAVIPFRDGINLSKMKKPFRRVIEPAITIGLVILAFTFIPWLSTGESAHGTITDRISAGVESLEKDMKGEAAKIGDKAKAPQPPGEKALNQPLTRSRLYLTDEIDTIETASCLRPRPKNCPIAEVIELEPTMTMDLIEPGAATATGSFQRRPGPAVAMVEGSLASLVGETNTLRRRRLGAAALFLAVAFGIGLVWNISGLGIDRGGLASLTLTTVGLRCAIAAALAGLLLSRVPLTHRPGSGRRVCPVRQPHASPGLQPVLRQPRSPAPRRRTRPDRGS